MTSTPKLTQEEANAIEWIKKQIQYKDIPSVFVEQHIKQPVWLGEASVLNGMHTDTLIRALYIGYEIDPQFKDGDWVVFKTKREVIGKLYTNEVNSFDVDRADNMNLAFYSVEWEHATLEEIKAEKERQVWNSIGRGVGEFKEGDVRLINDYSSVYTTLTGVAKNEYINGELSGFYPVESFIKF